MHIDKHCVNVFSCAHVHIYDFVYISYVYECICMENIWKLRTKNKWQTLMLFYVNLKLSQFLYKEDEWQT